MTISYTVLRSNGFIAVVYSNCKGQIDCIITELDPVYATHDYVNLSFSNVTSDVSIKLGNDLDCSPHIRDFGKKFRYVKDAVEAAEYFQSVVDDYVHEKTDIVKIVFENNRFIKYTTDGNKSMIYVN